MVQAGMRCLWSHRKKTALALLLLILIAVNLLAYLHARAMTHFAAEGTKTARPGSLTFLEKAGVLCTGVTVPRPTAGGRSPADVGLTFETRRMGGANGAELEAWYIPHPQAKGVVLLFHGYAACKADLLTEARAFHEMGYAALLVDFPGSGGSSGNETTLGVAEAEDVFVLTVYATAHWPERPLILYGQSMGSAAILRAVAVHGARPRALILESPFDRLLTTVGHRFEAMGLPAFPGAELLVFWGGVQHGFNGFTHNPADYAAAVDVPVLLLHGTADPWVHVPEVEAVFQGFHGPSQMELFADTGHESYAARAPERWQGVVRAFLARHH